MSHSPHRSALLFHETTQSEAWAGPCALPSYVIQLSVLTVGGPGCRAVTAVISGSQAVGEWLLTVVVKQPSAYCHRVSLSQLLRALTQNLSVGFSPTFLWHVATQLMKGMPGWGLSKSGESVTAVTEGFLAFKIKMSNCHFLYLYPHKFLLCSTWCDTDWLSSMSYHYDDCDLMAVNISFTQKAWKCSISNEIQPLYV